MSGFEVHPAGDPADLQHMQRFRDDAGRKRELRLDLSRSGGWVIVTLGGTFGSKLLTRAEALVMADELKRLTEWAGWR